MGLFKNEVGRPSNETIKKRNIFKGVCFVLVLIIIGLVTFILNDKGIISINNKKQESNNKVVDNKIVEKDISYGEDILYKVIGEGALHNLNEETFNSDAYKSYLSISKTDKEEVNYNCNELFDESIISPYDGSGSKSHSIKLNDKTTLLCVDGKQEIYSYENVNKNYKKLFGNKYNIDKKDNHIHLNYVVNYVYSEKKDSYVWLSCECGEMGNEIVYGVTKVYEKNNRLYIDLLYGEALDSGITGSETMVFDLKLNDGTIAKLTYDEIKNKETYKKYQDKLDKYTFTFFKEDGIYKFEKVKKVTNNL